MIDRYEQGLRRWYAKPELITPSPTTDGHERLGYKTQAEWEEEQRALKASMANAQKEEVGWLENLKRRLGRKRA